MRKLHEGQAAMHHHNLPSPEPALALPDPIPEPLENDPEIPGAFAASIEDFIFAGSANSRANVEFWKSAVEEELQSLNSNHIYETVLIPDGVTPISSKPVFRIKRNQTGNVEQYKVQIIACGFTQKEGVDYQEVFALVANLDSVQTLIALAAKHDLELDQMDVSTAYLNRELKKDLYMLPPEGVPIQPGVRNRSSLWSYPIIFHHP